MKGKIDKYGWIEIGRAGKMKTQSCPHSDMQRRDDGVNLHENCGDWCPLFGEPRPEVGTASVVLDLCQGKKLFLDEFTDERSDDGKE